MDIETENIEQVLDEPAEVYLEQEYPSYSRLAEGFLLFLGTILICEGVFTAYFRAVLDEKLLWWTRLTPYRLFPSELIFYGPALLISFFVVLRGRTAGYKTARGLWLLLPFWIVGAIQAVHGRLAGAPGNFWFTDFRQTVLMSYFAVVVCILGPRVRADVLLMRFCRIGAVLAVHNGAMGVLKFAGVIEYDSLLMPFFTSEMVFALMFALVLTRYIITGRSSKLTLWALAFGIIAPLNKPSIAAFVVVNIICLLLIAMTGRATGSARLVQSVKVFVVTAIFVAALLLWVFSIGKGSAAEWVRRTYLKEHVSAYERDISGRRFALYQWGFQQWRRHPIFGTGFGMHLIEQDEQGRWQIIGVHNYYILYLYQTGAICFAIVSAFFLVWLGRIYRYIKHCSQPQQYWPAVAMYAWILMMLVGSAYTTALGLTSVGFVYWICVGLLNDAESQYYMAGLYESDQ